MKEVNEKALKVKQKTCNAKFFEMLFRYFINLIDKTNQKCVAFLRVFVILNLVTQCVLDVLQMSKIISEIS